MIGAKFGPDLLSGQCPSNTNARQTRMYGSILELSLWMNNRREGFLRDEEGASTVEMVIMMAAGISLGLSATDMVSRGVENLPMISATACQTLRYPPRLTMTHHLADLSTNSADTLPGTSGSP